MVIPRVLMLLRKIDKLSTTVSGLGTMLDELKLSMETRFADIETDQNKVLATVLDPRFKDDFFQKESTKENIEEWISAAAECDDAPTQILREVAVPVVDEDEDELDDEYAAILSERRGVSGTLAGSAAAPKTTIIQEYALYRDVEVKPNKKSDPLDWWKVYGVKYPKLGKLVRKYLSAPPTSVPSERLFSEAEAIYDARRSRR